MDQCSMRRTRRNEATLCIEPSPMAVFAFEDFIDSIDFLQPHERLHLRLAGEEILDNIIRYSELTEGSRVALRASKRPDGPLLSFYFQSRCFGSFSSNWRDAQPLFDSASGRWRGIGMIMCKNLTLSMRFRHGDLADRVFLRFASDR